MTKNPYKNELQKREFFKHLRGAEGFSESSIKSFAGAISQWQFFTENDDFINFSQSKALAFRDWLKTKESKTETGHISLTTQYNYLRRIKRFFEWLCDQPDYRNKISKNDVKFIRLSKGDARIARSGTTRTIPTLEEAKKIIESIDIKNDIDKRDRAIICFALITGMRISAIASLKMKNFDKEKRLIDQNPGDGVKTKNSKRILTTFFPIGWDEPAKYFMEWFEYLEKNDYKPSDPIFPATIKEFSNKKTSYSKNSVSNNFWSGANSIRKVFEKRCKRAGLPYFHPHSFRHLVVSTLSKIKLTEEEKKAISLNLGHAHIGTTFGSYGYGNMNEEEAVEIVKKIDTSSDKVALSSKEREFLGEIMKKIL